jgi:hypothetical protein
VDKAKHYSTVEFLKEKSDATQEVINYLTKLTTQGQRPKVIRIDGGGEFVNKKLETWCKEHGVEIQTTTPYSPSQNGVAEWMNCTLVELGRAMLATSELLEFLWEHVIVHAAYLQNCSYTKHLQNTTPYQGWCYEKPNVSHLQEFGAPIWVLLQGQKEQHKMLLILKHQAYIGHDKGAKAVKYYNARTHVP